MKRSGYGLIFLLMFCLVFAGCAATFRPVDLNPRIKSGQLVQKADNLIVLFDKSASMTRVYGPSDKRSSAEEGEVQSKRMVDEDSRLIHGKDAVRNMIATIPEIKLNAGLRTFWGEKTNLVYGMNPLAKQDYTKAIDSIENPNDRTPMAKAITDAGIDLKGAKGNSAMIIVSDFSEVPGLDDIRPDSVMDAITRVNAEYGDKLCVYAIQVGYTLNGKELSERIVQNVEGGYTVNADYLVSPAGMGAFVDRIISGNCLRYKELIAKPIEKIVILAAEPLVEEKVIAAVPVPEPKVEEKAMVAAVEPKVIVLAFEDVHFDFDKSTLKPEAQVILKRNIQLLKDNPKAKVRIAGYTSASGTESYNQKLSERRATAVLGYLIDEGIITRDRLSTIGYGETDPAMYEAAPKELYSKAAKANMRVLFEIVVQ